MERADERETTRDADDVDDGQQHAGVHNILKTEYMTQEWGLPPRQVFLNSDGHWWITLDYRKSDSPSMAWIDVEIGEDIQIASSFPEFLCGLVPASEFDIDDA